MFFQDFLRRRIKKQQERKLLNELMHINGHFKMIFSRFEKPKHFPNKMKCCETL
jgi:uncharacterized protein YbgA (DUF1722 family)